jgi:hypothetical protein
MSKKPKANKFHETNNEVYFLINLRRRAAKQAINSILSSMCGDPGTIRNLTLLVEYSANMVYCLELMLKVATNRWSDHEVGEMYQITFGNVHPNANFMIIFKNAINDQKYLVSPVHGIAGFIPEMEALYDQMENYLSKNGFMLEVNFDFVLDSRSVEYLKNNAYRFHFRPYEIDEHALDYSPKLNEELDQIRTSLQFLLENRVDFILRYSTFSIPWLE